MSGVAFDPEIIQEFLTECGELLDTLEGDLIALEEDSSPDLVNQVFRALHTIKGSASFLALTELVEIAHAAETALNAARNGEAQVDQSLMDMLLRAVDIIKQQMDEIGSGTPLSKADPALVAGLTAIGEGGAAPDGSASPDGHGGDSGDGSAALTLDSSKAVLLDDFVADLDAQFAQLSEQVEKLLDDAERPGVAEQIEEIGEGLTATIDFFEFDSMLRLTEVVLGSVSAAAKSEQFELDQAVPRMRALLELVGMQRAGLAQGKLIEPDCGVLVERLKSLTETGRAEDDWRLPESADAGVALSVDGVKVADRGDGPADGIGAPTPTPTPTPDAGPGDAAPEAPTPEADGARNPGDTGAPGGAPAARGRAPAVEKTLRVEVNRLESLMNLVGELVLQKNRIGELTRRVASAGAIPPELGEPLELAGAGLDRLTGEIQVAVMRTRMQPLDKLFGKYPRLIRDLSRKTGKKLKLEIRGGETEVDRQVIEELGDPLVHLLRNSADHGIEMPEDRVAAGKPEEGIILLRAAHQGNDAVIEISDNGKGLSREKLGAKAVERGLVTRAELETLSDHDVYRFIFAPGFSTAAEVSDLSGRGVGMDVVRTNIERLKGSVDVTSTPGQGTRLLITIPLTVAIMPAMMVKLHGEAYAIPLSNITEIVRPTEAELSTVLEERVLRLRGSVVPLIDGAERFDTSPAPGAGGAAQLVVVLQIEEKTVGLLVSEVIGQQEIVIKPLDGLEKTGPFSGATVRNDGGVSLIIDVAELVRSAG
jgi:two-component system chemotaxis sensor kinase CheA